MMSVHAAADETLITDSRLVSLAAGVLPEFSPEETVYAAAQAGFNAVGIWCDLAAWTEQRSDAVARALAETGLCALDLEVAWFMPGEDASAHDAMVDIALELGARNLLCVSSEPDVARTRKRFAHLCRRAEGSELRVVLEFLAITEIRTLQQALDVVRDVGHPAGGILVDTLHLLRTGGAPRDLRGIDPALLPYLQLCDASAALADTSPDGVLDDALYLRRLPGEGELPLREILDAVDSRLPLSVEVRSRALMQEYAGDAVGRASAVFSATQKFLQA
jgi:sugar phosphate isomerase/epimerase